ncbi:4-hydroxy-tetrahydrodipicolinate synthase DapA [Methyloglobulus morosus KoM1]|uniref:4-hydroxy-tetrahydrodipicolinate synthase DapA n=1 Tax=Methyloglobulus morosus KoM1 TaxID=1116472 RepID=V5CA36_9GAMM|nr:4-hydroxy-tetrahydrodipicolinate synthase DapA [Methyloglobulus morosus KoM1]
MELLNGSVAALVTPFLDDAKQSVNREKLAELVKWHADSKTAAIVPCGTTGESPTLFDEEWDEVVSTVIEASRNTNLKVIPGTGSNSTREALRLTERAAKLGADACLVVHRITIGQALKVYWRISRNWIKWVSRSSFTIYPAEPESILGSTSSWNSAKSVRQ